MAESYIQLPPDSTGKKTRSRLIAAGGEAVHEQAVCLPGLPTYYIWTDPITFAQNKNFLSIFNNQGSGYILRVRALQLINLQTTSISGVVCQFDIHRTTEQNDGTIITPIKADSANPDFPSGIIVAKEATVVTAEKLWSFVCGNDEVAASSTWRYEQYGIFGFGGLVPNLPDTQPLTLRPGDGGITIRQITNTTVGSFGVLAVVTLEAV
jgi:hypothetical protein